MGIFSPLTGLIAHAPRNTPVFSLLSSPLSRSLLFCERSTYDSTSAFCSGVTSFLTNGCSGAKTIYVAPNNVSGRVVKTVISLFIDGSSNFTSEPTDFPIQFRCRSLTFSGQSTSSSPSNRDSA